MVTDIGRYFVPTINQDRFYGGTDYRYVGIDYRKPNIEAKLLSDYVNPYYDDERLQVGASAVWLGDLQAVLRVHPILLLQAFLLAALGAWFARGLVRATIGLLGGVGFAVIVIAAATSTYNARYVIPVDGPVIAAGAMGLWVLLSRSRTAEPGTDGPHG